MLTAETWAEMSEHGYRHEGSTTAGPSAAEVFDRISVGIRAAFGFRWEPRTIREFLEDHDFGEEQMLGGVG